MDRGAPSVSFGMFCSERIDTHAWAWVWLQLLGVWITLYAGVED